MRSMIPIRSSDLLFLAHCAHWSIPQQGQCHMTTLCMMVNVAGPIADFNCSPLLNRNLYGLVKLKRMVVETPVRFFSVFGTVVGHHKELRAFNVQGFPPRMKFVRNILTFPNKSEVIFFFEIRCWPKKRRLF
jgi:hypothetical protein